MLHRATPVLLPKQTTLDQHLHSVGARAGSAAARPPPALQQPLQQPQQRPRQAQQQRNQQKRQQSQTQLQASQPQQQQLSFAIAAPPRSIQNILNHANSMGSMSAARPKRKSAADADETLRGDTNGHAGASSNPSDLNGSRTIADTEDDDSDNALDSALRKRPRLAVGIVDYAKAKASPGLQSPSGALAPLPPPNRAGAATKTKTNTTNTSGSLAAAIPIAPSPSTTTTNTTSITAPTSSSTASTHTLTRPIAARQHHTITPATHHTAALDRATRDKAALSTTTLTAAGTPAQNNNSFAPAAPSSRPSSGRPLSKTTSQLAATTANPPTKEKEKAANGFKNQELKALQVSTADAEAVVAAATRGAREGGRKLRSQEATRFKSELAAYFPDYDEVIGNEPKEERESTFPPLFQPLNTLLLNADALSRSFEH